MISSLVSGNFLSIPSSPLHLILVCTRSMAGQFVRFSLTFYAPLNITQLTGEPHAMPTSEYRDRLPKFTSSNVISVEDHFDEFLKFVDDLDIKHEDVVMKMFVKTLEGDM